MTIRDRWEAWSGAFERVEHNATRADVFRAGYLAALEDAAKACELQMMAEDGLPEADAACAACAAAVRALGNS